MEEAEKKIRAIISVTKDKGTGKWKVKYLCDKGDFFEQILIPLCKEMDKAIDIEAVTTEESLDTSKILLVAHNPSDIFTGSSNSNDNTNHFAQDKLCLPDSVEERRKTSLLPIIHISLVDTFRTNLYGNTPLPPSIPRSYPIMDSSIWNYLLMINRHSKVFILRLFRIVKIIYSNYQNNLYALEVAREYADLNARLTKESFLSGSHALGVSPFIFHSESAIERLIRKELASKNFFHNEKNTPQNASTTEKIADRRWRLLLVDDKANEKMSTFNESKGKTKLEIITNLLEERLNLRGRIETINYTERASKKTEDSTILIEFAETIEEAERALKKRKYDIILLDYFLDKDKIQYGYEILNNIYTEIAQNKTESNNGDSEYKIGPHGRFFFMFISAYTSAVYERLLAEGLNRSEKYWHIAVGACPTNTPQLFLYNLLKLMEKQLEDSGIENLSAKSIFNTVNKIYRDKSGVRHRANDYYQEVLDMQYYYRKMLDDVQFPADGNIFNTTGSVLITDFIGKNVYLGGLLEHLTQLVHLTAFGTVRQWPEMWEEYIYFKSQFNMAMFLREGGKEEDFYKLCADIENYIIDLKSDRA